MSRAEDKGRGGFDERARRRLELVELFEALRLGSRTRARAAVARRVGLPETSLERVRRGRVKGIKAYVAEAVRGAFVAVISRELSELAQDLELARRGALAADELARGEHGRASDET